jgi:hypothetical protein
MGDFTTFYQNGGFFMHLITITAAVGIAAVLLHARSRAAGADNPHLLRVADRVAAIGVAIGAMGMFFGLQDLGMALTLFDPAQVDAVKLIQAAGRGGAIAPAPMNWSLMCAVPIWIATTVRSRA